MGAAGLGATQIEVTLALAPFAMSMSMTGMGVPASLWVVVAAGLAGAAAFAAISVTQRRQNVHELALGHE